jgi:hypothetical protein
MNYQFYRIKYISPCSHKTVFDEIFVDIVSALEWAKTNYGYALREKYFEIYGYKYIFIPLRITLNELSKNKLIGKFIEDDHEGYYEYN